MDAYGPRFIAESERKTTSPLKFRSSFDGRRASGSSDRLRLSVPADSYSGRFDSFRPMISPRGKLGSSLLEDVERQHEQTLKQVYNRLELSERAHQAEVAALQAQASSLRQQLDLSVLSHVREVEVLRREFEDKLHLETMSQESVLNTLVLKTKDAQQGSNIESERCSRLRQEILEVKESHSDYLGKLLVEQRNLQQEIEYLKEQKIPGLTNEFSRLKEEKVRLQDDCARTESITQQEHLTLLNDLKLKLDAKEALARNLEYDATDLRHQIQVRTETYSRDVQALQETIKSTRGVIDIQERDIAKLKHARAEAKKDSQELESELTGFEKEVKHAKSRNHKLKSDAQTLQRLVYGKATKKGTSPKT